MTYWKVGPSERTVRSGLTFKQRLKREADARDARRRQAAADKAALLDGVAKAEPWRQGVKIPDKW